MRRSIIRWMAGTLGAGLTLIALSTPVQSGYTLPCQASSLRDEALAFIGDFGQWNARLDNMPLLILAEAPTAIQGEVLLWLFWLWLHQPRAGLMGDTFPSSLSGPTVLTYSPPPPVLGNPPNLPIEPIGTGQSGDGPSGNDSLSSSNGGDNTGNHLPSQGSSLDSGTPSPSEPDPGVGPMPAPAAFTLLAIGSVILLLARWLQQTRRAGSVSSGRAQSSNAWRKDRTMPALERTSNATISGSW